MLCGRQFTGFLIYKMTSISMCIPDLFNWQPFTNPIMALWSFCSQAHSLVMSVADHKHSLISLKHFNTGCLSRGNLQEANWKPTSKKVARFFLYFCRYNLSFTLWKLLNKEEETKLKTPRFTFASHFFQI